MLVKHQHAPLLTSLDRRIPKHDTVSRHPPLLPRLLRHSMVVGRPWPGVGRGCALPPLFALFALCLGAGGRGFQHAGICSGDTPWAGRSGSQCVA
jgi:hypothetical protein